MTARHWKPWVAVLCLGLLPVWLDTPADDLSAAAAINKAGRQRMLTQRIVKAYCQLGLGVMPQVSEAQLSRAVRLFDTQLAELKAFAPDRKTWDALAKLEELWQPFRQTATGAVSREGAQQLSARDEDLLNAAQQATEILEHASGTPVGRLVNISGRQRMLSQRLTKFYMLRLWGFDTPAVRAGMESAVKEFSAALATLRAAPENTPAIAKELDAVALQWEWFRSALSLEGAYSYRLIVADASEAILNSMELVTGMYEQLPFR
jgi:PilJ/NarX-like methyl-accepting chemotaxis transducer